MTQRSPANVILRVLIVEDDTVCPRCGSRAWRHQPDHLLPERLLATCDQCGSWSLLQGLPDGLRTIALPLPTGAELAESTGVFKTC